MKTTKEMIEVMQAYERGEKIQFLNINNDWKDTKSPTWNWCMRDYRVKPKKKYVPFDTPEEFFAEQRKHGCELITIECGEKKEHYVSVTLDGNVYDHMDDGDVDCIGEFKDLLFEDYKFADGTPCGKEVEA